MSREKLNGVLWGLVVSLILAGCGGGLAMAFDTREKCATFDARLNGNDADHRDIKERVDRIEVKVDELLKRVK